MLTGLIIISREYTSLVYGQYEIAAISRRLRLAAPPLTPEEVRASPELLKDIDVIFGGWAMPVMNQALLRSGARLSAIFYAGGSVKHFVTEALWQRGIRVSSAWEANGAAVADYTVGAILFGLKQGFAGQASTRRTLAFKRPDLPCGTYGSTVALISLGASGRAVAQKLLSFGMRVVAYDPYVTRQQAATIGVEMVGLDEAFSNSDAISIHTPVTSETIGMIQGHHFSQMRNGALFINSARGVVVIESEMIQVLSTRSDITAVIDVTEPEPPAPDSPLYRLPNVVLTPHMAGALGRDCRRLVHSMIEEFDRWKSAMPLRCEITAGMINRMA